MRAMQPTYSQDLASHARIEVLSARSFLLVPSMVAPGAMVALEEPKDELVPLKEAKLTTMVTAITGAPTSFAAIGKALLASDLAVALPRLWKAEPKPADPLESLPESSAAMATERCPVGMTRVPIRLSAKLTVCGTSR